MDPDPHGWYHVDHSTPTPGWFGHTPPQPQEPPSQPTVTHEQLAQLFNQVNVLSAQNANLQAQLSALQTQSQAAAQQAPPVTTAPAASVTPVTVARPSGHKVAVPDIFDGTRAKAKDFLRQLFVYFSASPSAFSGDDDKIYFALSYMRGHTAGPWANRHIDLLAEGKKPFANYSAFHQAVLAYFRDPHEAANAGSQLKTIRQGTMTADELIGKFRELASLAGYDEAATRDCFIDALNSQLRLSIYGSGIAPTTL